MLQQNNTGRYPALQNFKLVGIFKNYTKVLLFLFSPSLHREKRKHQYNFIVNLNDLPQTFTAKVSTEHLDFLGHMNVMWYTHFFDMATWGFYNRIGFGHDYHLGENGSFALEFYTRHLAELRVDDEFRIFTRALGHSKKLFHFMHFMQRTRDKELAATCELLGIHINMNTRRSSPMPDPILEIWDGVINEHCALDWEAPVSGSMAP